MKILISSFPPNSSRVRAWGQRQFKRKKHIGNYSLPSIFYSGVGLDLYM